MKPRNLLIYSIALAGLILTALLGCNSAPGPNKPFPFGTFRIEGILVSDPNTDTVKAIVHLDKSNNAFAQAEVYFDDSLFTAMLSGFSTDTIYYFDDRPYLSFTAGAHYVIVDDTNGFRDSALINLPDSFKILTVSPFNHQIAGNPRTASLSWSTSTNSGGFILAAVKNGMAYTGSGWSGYVQTFGTAGTIPPEAFLLPDGINPDTGLYNIYVYSYTGAPDSALSSLILPVPLPGQLQDNLDSPDFSGRFGTVMVTAFDTVRVTQQ